ncbi:MAG: adenylosuccinate synthetase, partial [bacterium]|nr:adenylosuccinate synthetase [bacterium]
TTGRPRRCGWFDAVVVRFANRLNGFTGIAVTKLDVLDSFAKIPLCVGYKINGEILNSVPDPQLMSMVEPIYEIMEGWQSSTRLARSFAELPATAQRYLRRIEELVGAPIAIVSVGPDREETFFM